MPTSGTTTYDWQIEVTPPGGVGSTLTFNSGSEHSVRPSAFKLDQRDDVAASSLEIRFPDAQQFLNAWLLYNPTAPGTEVVLRVDGFTRFTGWVKNHRFNFSGNERSVTIVAYDRMGMLKDAVVNMALDREIIASEGPTEGAGRRFLMTRSATDGFLFEAITADATPLFLRPWHTDYIAIVWVILDGEWFRVPFSEYEVLSDIGAIYFRYSRVKVIGETDDDSHALDDIEDDVFCEFVYFDADDDSTMISNLLREAFEYPEIAGGLGWTEGVEYDVDDETVADILSAMKWNTDEGDGDAVSFLQALYENPRIGLAPSYWIRDFNGNGTVNARLVLQDNDAAIDIDLIYNAQFPSPLSNIYTRAVLVNNEATRRRVGRDDDATPLSPFHDTFVTPTGFSTTETPGMEADAVSKGIEYLNDDTSKTSWGHFSIGNKNQYPLDQDIPHDVELFRFDIGATENVDIIHLNTRFTFNGGEDGQKILHDTDTKEEAYNGLYVIHENQRITVEYSTDTDATPGDETWFALHPDLWNAEVDPLDGKNSWLTVDGINRECRWLRVIVNNPLFGKVSETNWTNKAFRILLWWMSEFQVYTKGRVLDGDTEEQPEVRFTDDPDDEFRCMCNLAGDTVDMYRPTLLTITGAMGLKFRTLVLNAADVWEFLVKDDEGSTPADDCSLVSIGYKYMVTMLDSFSKENEWSIMIDPRPDVRIGSTVYSSKLDSTKKFLVHQNVLQLVSARLTQRLLVSDHETASGGEGTGCL